MPCRFNPFSIDTPPKLNKILLGRVGQIWPTLTSAIIEFKNNNEEDDEKPLVEKFPQGVFSKKDDKKAAEKSRDKAAKLFKNKLRILIFGDLPTVLVFHEKVKNNLKQFSTENGTNPLSDKDSKDDARRTDILRLIFSKKFLFINYFFIKFFRILI